ncbi:MAG: exosortase T [Bradymonadaceae bacterium]
MIDIATIQRQPLSAVTAVALVLGAVVLAAEPAHWLVETWTAPAYDSPGGYIFAAVLGLGAWSFTSPRTVRRPSRSHVWWLFGATALIRLAGRLLAIHVLGAVALAIDVYALAVVADLGRRRRAVSPLWLAVLFSLSLPIERIVQRLVGYGLQHLSAGGACSLLQIAFDDVACSGVDIRLLGERVLVDLPCSGAQGLVLFCVLFAGLASIARPTVRESAVGVGLAALSALVANSLRIALLAAGLAHEARLGIDVMNQPWHDAVGLVCLAVGFVPLLMWGRYVYDGEDEAVAKGGATPSLALQRWDAVPDVPGRQRCRRTKDSCDSREDTVATGASATASRALSAAGFLIVATTVLFVPHNPVDVAESAGEITLPDRLDGHHVQPRELQSYEKAYFQKFGGGVAKATYGPHTLLVVETSAPLRHLHAPDACLGGAGYEVETLGKTHGALPSASYLARKDGQAWRVDVTYVSDTGRVATSVAEAVWYWLKSPETTWRAIQRFHPAEISPRRRARFDRQVADFFDIAVPAPPDDR